MEVAAMLNFRGLQHFNPKYLRNRNKDADSVYFQQEDIDGYEGRIAPAIRYIFLLRHKEHPDARIVVISSLAYDDTYERAKAIGVKGFVDKPFHQNQLLQVFKEALA